VIESPRFATIRDRSRPVETNRGAESDADLAAAIVSAVAEKRWAVAEVLAAEVQRREREQTPRNLFPIDSGRRGRR
jgi:hypothetical protein